MIRGSIKNELELRGWSVKKISDMSGVRYPSLTEYLNGNKELSSSNLEKIFEKLDFKIFSENDDILK